MTVYAIGAVLGVAALVALGVVVLAGGDEGKADAAALYPDGGEVPTPEVTDVQEAAAAANCDLQTVKVKSREHVSGEVDYPSTPPAGGNHLEVPADDGVYEESPQAESLVHALEHGRVVIWFKRRADRDLRANLKALLDADSYQQLLTPDPTGMSYEVAATAWNRDPEPLGTGRLLGCAKANDRTYDALAAFRDEHRSNGPEPVP